MNNLIIFFQSHLEIMLRALKDFIMDQNKENLETTLTALKKSLDFDSTAIDHLHLALYSFQVNHYMNISNYLFFIYLTL